MPSSLSRSSIFSAETGSSQSWLVTWNSCFMLDWPLAKTFQLCILLRNCSREMPWAARLFSSLRKQLPVMKASQEASWPLWPSGKAGKSGWRSTRGYRSRFQLQRVSKSLKVFFLLGRPLYFCCRMCFRSQNSGQLLSTWLRQSSRRGGSPWKNFSYRCIMSRWPLQNTRGMLFSFKESNILSTPSMLGSASSFSFSFFHTRIFSSATSNPSSKSSPLPFFSSCSYCMRCSLALGETILAGTSIERESWSRRKARRDSLLIQQKQSISGEGLEEWSRLMRASSWMRSMLERTFLSLWETYSTPLQKRALKSKWCLPRNQRVEVLISCRLLSRASWPKGDTFSLKGKATAYDSDSCLKPQRPSCMGKKRWTQPLCLWQAVAGESNCLGRERRWERVPENSRSRATKSEARRVRVMYYSRGPKSARDSSIKRYKGHLKQYFRMEQLQMNEMEEANIEDLEEYRLQFYEEKLELKIAMARKILLLTLDMNNLQTILDHDSLMGTLSRVLKEEFKKSMELCTYLLSIFFVFSNYQQFQPIILQNQIGDSIMNMLEYQIHRYDTRIDEFNNNKHHMARPDLDKEIKRLNRVIGKQDKLFYICLSILLNLAEDFQIEKKMKKRKILEYLVRMLERNDFHLLIIVLLFLRKMCIVSENQLQLQELDIVKKLDRFFSCNNNILLQLTLGLLKNLCFDHAIRKNVEKAHLIPKVYDLLKLPNFRFFSILLLYLLSLDQCSRPSFAKTDCIKYVVKLIIHFPEKIVGQELIALGINLSTDRLNAEQVSEDDLQKLVDRALENNDTLIFKVIKNVARFNSQDFVKDCLSCYLGDFLQLALDNDKNEDLKVELLGLMSNLSLGSEWLDHLDDYALEFLYQNMQVGAVEDDVILETLNLIAQLCSHKKVVQLLDEKQVLNEIWGVFMEKSEDKEFIYVVLYIIYLAIHHEVGIEEVILEKEEVLLRMLEYVTDQNAHIRKMVDEVLDSLKDYNEDLAEKLRERKFYFHNRLWLESINDYEKQLLDMNINYQYQLQQQQMMDDEGLDPRMWDWEEDD